MNEVKLARSAGFCFGVKRAVELVYEEAKKGGDIYTYGPIIHNEEVVGDLENKGVRVINSPEEIDNLKSGTIIIRSHGVSKDIYDRMINNGLNVIDATCPFVKKIHNIVSEESNKGNVIVIVGNKDHPEVQGIKGWSNGETYIIDSKEEIDKITINNGKKVCVVAQTTFNFNKFKELVEILTKRVYDIIAVNTICNATKERQTEAKSLALESDAMIVIGGRHSSNTQKLYQICKSECDNTMYIQTLDDLVIDELTSVRSVGITAGASTPNNIIEEVWQACQKKILQNY
mgnify:FL=1